MGSKGKKSGGGGGDSELLDSVAYDRDREYDKFEDRASGTHTYAGDGSKQEQWFAEHSNFDELIAGMSPDERSAFRDWTRGYFMDGTQYRGWDGMDKTSQDITRRMDEILDRATLDKGIIVTRRTSAELLLGKGKARVSSLDELTALRGTTVSSAGAMSTGAAREGLTIGDSSKNVELRIHIAGGTTGAGMWVGDHRINGWGSEQREFVMNRDAVFAVGASRYDAKRGVYVSNIYYMGRKPHDYGKKGK